MKRNPLVIRLVKCLPNKPHLFSRFLKKHYQEKLNNWLTNSMEDFDYTGFKLALYCGADANVDARTKQGYPLVTRCARSGEKDFLDTLLRFGGDVHAQLPAGEYLPIHMAATKGMASCIEVLAQHGADIHATYQVDGAMTSSLGRSALICACMHGKTLAAKTLLDLGANPFDINEKGVSAVDICLKMENWELADYILQKQMLIRHEERKSQDI